MSAFTVDYLPAVVEFCKERIKQLSFAADPSAAAPRIDELQMIITLCEGLGQQHKLLAATLRLPSQETVDRMNEGQPFPKATDLQSRTAYFTFGQSHVHSVNGKTFDKDCVVKITSPDPRGVMCAYFKDKWAAEYDDPPDPFFYSRGIFELP